MRFLFKCEYDLLHVNIVVGRFDLDACICILNISSQRKKHFQLSPLSMERVFGAVSAPTLSARVPRRARAAFEK